MNFKDAMKKIRESNENIIDNRTRMDWEEFKQTVGACPIVINDIDIIKNAGKVTIQENGQTVVKKTDIFAFTAEEFPERFFWASGDLKKDFQKMFKEIFNNNIEEMRKAIKDCPVKVSITWVTTQFGNDMLKYSIVE